jgi:hypothetical protein
MEQQAQIAKVLNERYGLLLFAVHKRDVGWQCFEVVWSDDGGATTIADEMTANNMAKRLAGLTKEHVAYLLRERRMTATSTD